MFDGFTLEDGPLSSAVIDSGHHQAEQAPDQLAATLLDFLG